MQKSEHGSQILAGMKDRLEQMTGKPATHEFIDTAMQAGDYVEFLSDKQTEKGPSTGVISISMGNRVLIKHSDCSEEFKVDELEVFKKSTHHKGGVLWMLV